MTIEQDIFTKVHDSLVGVDQTIAASIFDTGNDITISSRCGMALIDAQLGKYKGSDTEKYLLEGLGKALDEVQTDHCYQAIQGDYERASEILQLLVPYMKFLGKLS